MATAIAAGDLLGPAEVAQLLDVKVQTLSVWRCVGRHSLPYVKVGRLIRYRRQDVDAWLTGRTMTHTGQAAD